MNRVDLTKDEAEWFVRNVRKTKTILEAASSKDPAVLERMTYKTIVKINLLIDETGEAATSFLLTPKQKKTVGMMISNTRKVLLDKILPIYKTRGLVKYAEDVEMKLTTLASMQRKFR